ncbi:MAG TPA: thiamine pyrophosphate-binding protein [Nevskiaceae bacterium]|nr:thiamine pyrophosphate-binding protein [Nevskiaceae bacterium]
MKVCEAIAHALSDLGVDPLFGLIGDGNLFMVDHFVGTCGGRYVRATHEANAVLMALGHAQISGGVGVATVTHGPALTNTVTALVEGVKSAVPMVLLAGDTPAMDRGHPQKIDQKALVAVTGAGFEPLRSAGSVGEDLTRAYTRARIERRPIVFNMPIELQWKETRDAPIKPPYTPQIITAPARGAELDQAVGIIASAHWPVVIAGRGAIAPATRAAILHFAERIEAPVATTLRGKDLFRDEAYNLGFCGTLSTPVALDTLTKSDCLIVFGASLNKYTASRGDLLKGKRVVQINPVATEIGRYFPVTAALVCDPGLAADAMVAVLDDAQIAGSGARTEDLRQALAQQHVPAHMSKPPRDNTVDFLEALDVVDRAFPQERVYVTDCGRFILGAWTRISVQRPQDFVHVMGFTAIGLGLGEAIGAALAGNGRPTLLVTGDGGFMLGGVNELVTAVREHLDLVIVVCNDGSYGAEYRQFTARDMDPKIALLEWPDFAPIAQAFGIAASTVRSTADLQQAATAIIKRDHTRPLLIDLRLDPDRMLTL